MFFSFVFGVFFHPSDNKVNEIKVWQLGFFFIVCFSSRRTGTLGFVFVFVSLVLPCGGNGAPTPNVEHHLGLLQCTVVFWSFN